MLRIESRLNVPYPEDGAYILIEGEAEKLWELFGRWSKRFSKLGHTLTAAPEYVCDPDAVTEFERMVRLASVEANSYDDFMFLRWDINRARSRKYV